MGVIYEVNLRVDRDIARAYAAWLSTHIEEMLAFEGFESARWFERESEIEGDPGDRALWTIQYHVRERADLERYLVEGAARMRGDGLARFTGRFEASRRVLHGPIGAPREP